MGEYVNFRFVILYIITGMFYYSIGNLPPELRSTQRAIQLIACVSSPHIGEYGLQPILQPFIDDVNTLAKVRMACCETVHYGICSYAGWYSDTWIS